MANFTLLQFFALQAAALQRWRAYAAHCRRKAGRRRMACALALRHARRRLSRSFGTWRGQAAAQARRRAAGAAALQRVIRVRLRRCVSVWRLAALRQARPACQPLLAFLHAENLTKSTRTEQAPWKRFVSVYNAQWLLSA